MSKRIAIDYTPAVRQQAGIGRIIRGQVAGLVSLLATVDAPAHTTPVNSMPPNKPHTPTTARSADYDLRLFVAGPVAAAQRAQAPLPIHATPLRERDLVRIWHRLNLPIPRVEWFTGGPLDIFHATDFVLPPSHARRKILTVHDLAFLFFPEAAMPGLQRYLNVVVPRSVARADHIIADSAHTAQDLHEQWNVPRDEITVVYGAVDHTRFQPVTDAATRAAVRQKYALGNAPIILALSRLEPRKNLVRLIQAFEQARRRAKLPHRLIIGGAKGWLYDEIFTLVEQLHLQEHVHLPGFIDDQDLPALFSLAEFFAYPSLYEGFGLPIIEALACGIPVLTADNSCLPEAGGPGARYVNALDIDAIAQGIEELASNAVLRHDLARAGRAHAQRFTWQNSATTLLAVYEKMLAE